MRWGSRGKAGKSGSLGDGARGERVAEKDKDEREGRRERIRQQDLYEILVRGRRKAQPSSARAKELDQADLATMRHGVGRLQ